MDISTAKRDEILKKWLNTVISSYPDKTAQFLHGENNPFANPVGSIINKSFSVIIDYLFYEINEDELHRYLDEVIRIRSVQGHNPSKVLSFLFDLKDILYEIFSNEVNKDNIFSLLNDLDKIIQKAFDIYMNCREELLSLRSREIERTMFRRLEKRGGAQ